MTIKLKGPDIHELKPRITVFGVGGAGGNAVNNMIECGLEGVEFVVANTDAQALSHSRAERIIQMGLQVTEGLGAGAQPEVGRAAAEEVIDEIRDQLLGAHMVFITAGMGGGTGTGAAPVVARAARELGILTVGVVTKPFQFEGLRRMRICEAGIAELQRHVDTLIVIPNQNLFRVANEKTLFAEAFAMADQVLYSGVASITDLMVKPGLINLDFADVRAVMREMGKAMMGTGEASGERRALLAAEAAIANPLLDETSMKGAQGLLISITGGKDMMLYELDEAATRIREEVDPEANIILGATQDPALDGIIRVSVVATGIDRASIDAIEPVTADDPRVREAVLRLRQQAAGSMTSRAVEVASAPAPVAAAITTATVPVEPARPIVPPDMPAEPAPAAPAATAPEAPPVAVPASPVPELPAVASAAAAPSIVERGDIAHGHERASPASADPVFDAVTAALDRAVAEPARGPRMPRIEDLPPHVQPQLREGAAQAPHPVEARRMTLLQRLAAVGLGRREEGAPPPVPVALPAPVAEPPRRAPAAVAPSARGQLDAHGRVQPRSIEDEQLEIPAFLRRQQA